MKKATIAWRKVILALICFAIAIVGFMAKLPSQFRHIDKELHAAFYFSAAAFLNILFVGKKLGRHILVFAFLFLFGLGIEYAQEWSKKNLQIQHGRFDPEDVKWNLAGLVTFSGVWILYAAGAFLFRKENKRQPSDRPEATSGDSYDGPQI